MSNDSFKFGKKRKDIFEYTSMGGHYRIEGDVETGFVVLFQNNHSKLRTEKYSDFLEAVKDAIFLAAQDNKLSQPNIKA